MLLVAFARSIRMAAGERLVRPIFGGSVCWPSHSTYSAKSSSCTLSSKNPPLSNLLPLPPASSFFLFSFCLFHFCKFEHDVLDACREPRCPHSAEWLCKSKASSTSEKKVDCNASPLLLNISRLITKRYSSISGSSIYNSTTCFANVFGDASSLTTSTCIVLRTRESVPLSIKRQTCGIPRFSFIKWLVKQKRIPSILFAVGNAACRLGEEASETREHRAQKNLGVPSRP